MRKGFAIVYRLITTALALTPVALLAGQLITGGWEIPLRWMLAATGLSLLTALLPGAVERSRRPFPLRAVAGGAVALCLIGAAALWPALTGGLAVWLACLFALLFALFYLLMLRECAMRIPFFSRLNGFVIGLGLYLVAGIAIWALEFAGMNAILYGCGAAFLVLGAFLLNGESLDIGYASQRSVQPPARVSRANRWLLLLLIGIVAFVAAFDRIRQWASDAALACVRAIARFIGWLLSLGPEQELLTGDMQSGESGMPPMDGSGEPNLFWQILYYVVLALACVLIAFLLYKGVRILAKKLKILWGRMTGYFKRFAQTVGEEYVDERVSLFDSSELRRSLEERLRKGIHRLTRREKRWEQMDAREKARFIVRSLYRKAGDSVPRLSSMTAREALRQVNTAQADPDALSDLYDRARYGEEPPDESAADALRKAAKV